MLLPRSGFSLPQTGGVVPEIVPLDVIEIVLSDDGLKVKVLDEMW